MMAMSGFTGIVCFVCLTLDKELKQSVSRHSLSGVCKKTLSQVFYLKVLPMVSTSKQADGESGQF